MIRKLIDTLKEDEGFEPMPYQDHLDNPTIGIGTLLPISEYEAELILKNRLQLMIKELHSNKPFVEYLPEDVKEALYNMAYNMGVPRLLKFKKMFSALEDGDYDEAYKQALDSRWAEQVPSRAKRTVEVFKKFA